MDWEGLRRGTGWGERTRRDRKISTDRGIPDVKFQPKKVHAETRRRGEEATKTKPGNLNREIHERRENQKYEGI